MNCTKTIAEFLVNLDLSDKESGISLSYGTCQGIFPSPRGSLKKCSSMGMTFTVPRRLRGIANGTDGGGAGWGGGLLMMGFGGRFGVGHCLH